MNEEKVAVVTGATSGIGEATVRTFSRRGIHVVASGRRRERLRRLEADLNRNGGRAVVGVAGDVKREGLVTELFGVAEEAWGRRPTVFVLCAGRGLPGSVLQSDDGKWRLLVETNYLAALQQLRESGRLFVSHATDDGSVPRDIVVIGSTIGRHVSPFNPVYGSTKFALHSLVEGLRQEVCSKNIRVTLVEPGFVKSEFQRTADYDLEWFRAIERDVGPLLTPDDVARTIDFVVHQPAHVHVDDIRIRPTRQAV